MHYFFVAVVIIIVRQWFVWREWIVAWAHQFLTIRRRHSFDRIRHRLTCIHSICFSCKLSVCKHCVQKAWLFIIFWSLYLSLCPICARARFAFTPRIEYDVLNRTAPFNRLRFKLKLMRALYWCNLKSSVFCIDSLIVRQNNATQRTIETERIEEKKIVSTRMSAHIPRDAWENYILKQFEKKAAESNGLDSFGTSKPRLSKKVIYRK